jgi:uncharacterized protein HemX
VADGQHLDAVTMWKREAGKKEASGSSDQTGYAPCKEAAGPGVTSKSIIEQSSDGSNPPSTSDAEPSTSTDARGISGDGPQLLSGALGLGAGLAAGGQQQRIALGRQ